MKRPYLLRALSNVSVIAALMLCSCMQEQVIESNPYISFDVAVAGMSVSPFTKGENAIDTDGSFPSGTISMNSDDGQVSPMQLVHMSYPGIESVVPGTNMETKGTLYNTTGSTQNLPNNGLNSFRVKAYAGAYEVFRFSEGSVETVTYDNASSQWKMTTSTYEWPEGQTITFMAWMNAAGLDISCTKDALTVNGYSVPATASAQKDLLLGYYKGSADDENAAKATILFDHPMTSVVFNQPESTSTKIKNIEIEGVWSGGALSMSASNGSFVWSGLESTAKVSNTVSGTVKLDEPFILIPQNLETDPVTVIITVDDGTASGTKYKKTIDWGEWKAGETNVYSVVLTNLGIDVTDEIVSSVKKNLAIQNTGNVPEYIRAVIVANWYDDSGNIVSGWQPSEGTFEGLCGSGWVKEGDFYYYTSPVEPGQVTGSKLFVSYTPVAAPVDGAHLEMNIITQAVKAERGKTYSQAFNI